jgi:hypothetical protein
MISFVNGFMIPSPHDLEVVTGDNNDVVISSSIVRATPADSAAAITGLQGSTIDGELVFISNVSSTHYLVVKNNSSSSVVANRIFNNSGTDINIPPRKVACYKYVEGTGYLEFNFYQSEIVLEPNGVIYFGDKNTDGSWRMKIDSGSLVREKRIAGVWIPLGSDSE